MAKTKISEYSSTANSNTDIASINIDEGCAPSGINNAIRALMAQIHDLYAGTSGDTWPVAGGGTGSGTAAGARTNLGLAIGTDVQAYSATLASYANGNTLGFKNRIINGAMQIWQRGTSGVSGYVADRWFTTGTTGFAQQADAPSNAFQYCADFGNSGSGSYPALCQRIESVNSRDLSGQNVTVGFWAKSTGGTNYTLNVELKVPTATDNYTSTTTLATNTVTLTTSWAYYTTTFSSVSSSVVNGLQLAFYRDNTQSCYTRITGVQLEKGSTATSFDYRPYGTELALCQRYFTTSYDPGFAPGSSNATDSGGFLTGTIGAANSTSIKTIQLTYPVTMRTSPTVVPYDTAGTALKVSADTVGAYTANQTYGVSNPGYKSLLIFMNNGLSCAAVVLAYTASAEL